MSNVKCKSCELINWSTAKNCDRCRESLEKLPNYEYPPLSQKEPPEWSWQIIYEADKNPSKLFDILMQKSEEEICNFQGEFIQAAADLRDEPFTDYMQESEDGIEDISLWVVSQGKEYYLNILENPNDIPYSSEDDTNYEETLVEVAYKVFEEKFGQELHLMW